MKTRVAIIAVLGLLVVAALFGVYASQKEQDVPDAAAPVGSIRPRGKPTATQRAALAKITFQAAFDAAVAAVPGQVTYGELEVEDGNLQYDFQIITAKKKVMDVGIDAGNGKVLSVDKGDDE